MDYVNWQFRLYTHFRMNSINVTTVAIIFLLRRLIQSDWFLSFNYQSIWYTHELITNKTGTPAADMEKMPRRIIAILFRFILVSFLQRLFVSAVLCLYLSFIFLISIIFFLSLSLSFCRVLQLRKQMEQSRSIFTWTHRVIRYIVFHFTIHLKISININQVSHMNKKLFPIHYQHLSISKATITITIVFEIIVTKHHIKNVTKKSSRVSAALRDCIGGLTDFYRNLEETHFPFNGLKLIHSFFKATQKRLLCVSISNMSMPHTYNHFFKFLICVLDN